MNKRIVKLLLMAVLLIPFGICGASRIVETDELSEAADHWFGGRVNTGYSNFVMFKYDVEKDSDIPYSFDWDKNRTIITDFDDDSVDWLDNELGELDSLNVEGESISGRSLEMEEEVLNQGHFQYKVIDEDRSVLYSSSFIYSSSTIGESLGNVSEYDDNDMNVYELQKIDGGADYITDSGNILFSTTDDDDIGYDLNYNYGRISTFMNDKNVVIVYFSDNPGSSIINRFTVESLKTLLNTDDLDGIMLTSDIKSTQGDSYIEALLNNKVYFIDPDITKILYKRQMSDNEYCDFYGANHNNKDYIFADYYSISPEGQILTEVFDLEGNRYYDNNEWINLYFTEYSALYGVRKIDDKYYAIFINDLGEELIRKDITDAEVGDFYYHFYGEIVASNHDTEEIDSGKYLLEYYNDYGEDGNKYEIMTVLDRYDVIEGANQIINFKSDKGASFKINANNNYFDKLFINNEELDPSNYTVTKGSTIITLLPSYLKTLEGDTYTIKATFTNNGEVTTQFKIVKPIVNPKTGDSIDTTILLGIISLVTLLIVKIYLKKEKAIL